MKIGNKKIICLAILGVFLFSSTATALKISNQPDPVLQMA
jgi:hypothetical protein